MKIILIFPLNEEKLKENCFSISNIHIEIMSMIQLKFTKYPLQATNS